MTHPAALIVSAVILAGCAAPLPQYPPMTPRQSLDVLAQRAESVEWLSAECDVTLTDAAGESVRLDGAIAAAFPDRLRVRAWKFGNAAFDITVAGGRTWVLTSDSRSSGRRPDAAAMAGADRLPRALGLLGPEYFRAAGPAPVDAGDNVLIVAGPAFDDATAICAIDRATLTVRALAFTEGKPGTRHRVKFDRYRMIGGLAWPTVLEFAGPEGAIALRLRDVTLNEPLAESAFVPPRRAVEQP